MKESRCCRKGYGRLFAFGLILSSNESARAEPTTSCLREGVKGNNVSPRPLTNTRTRIIRGNGTCRKYIEINTFFVCHTLALTSIQRHVVKSHRYDSTYAGFRARPICKRRRSRFSCSLPVRSASRARSMASTMVTTAIRAGHTKGTQNRTYHSASRYPGTWMGSGRSRGQF